MRRALVIAVVILLVAYNGYTLWEAYGNGAPYYSRTTNMDKWKSPLPLLAMVDIVAMAVLFATAKFSK